MRSASAVRPMPRAAADLRARLRDESRVPRLLLAACRLTRAPSASDGDILVVTPDGEFFKYLHSASGR